MCRLLSCEFQLTLSFKACRPRLVTVKSQAIRSKTLRSWQFSTGDEGEVRLFRER